MALQMMSRNVGSVQFSGTRHGVIVHACKKQLLFCHGKLCKKQGGPQLLKFAKDLGLDEVEVGETGCLGNCGKGPNMVILPEGLTLRHVSTARDVANILAWQCKVDIPDSLLTATELRLAGNMHAMSGEFEAAIAKYNEALALDPPKGKHMLHSNLSAAYLQSGNKEAALQQAQAAVELAPKGFHMAHVRLIDALYALGRFQDVAAAVQAAVRSDASFKALPEYKVIEQALKKQRVTAT